MGAFVSTVNSLKMCKAIKGTVRLGSPKEILKFGRNAYGHVANFESPEKVPEDQRFQMEDHIAVELENEGLEFIRAWDGVAVSAISMVPFVLSLAFAGAWIGISMHKYGVNGQVATQTAFTVAAYIVTAGG